LAVGPLPPAEEEFLRLPRRWYLERGVREGDPLLAH
jgi:hypothetical protein